MSATTARGAFPYPTGTDNWKLIRTAIQALADQMAAVGALYVESTAATRPAVGVAGRFHRATDTGVLSLDTGSAWVAVPNAAAVSGFLTGAAADAAYLALALVDAKGDIPVGSADNTIIRKPVGANNTIFTADSAAPGGVDWKPPAAPVAHAVRAVATAVQSIPNATYTAVALGGETLDTDGFHDNATNNSRLTVPAGLGGKYVARGHLLFAGAAGGDRIGRIAKNGATQNLDQAANAGGSAYVRVHPTMILSLAAGDYVEMLVYQDSGAALNTAGSTGDYANLELVYLGT